MAAAAAAGAGQTGLTLNAPAIGRRPRILPDEEVDDSEHVRLSQKRDALRAAMAADDAPTVLRIVKEFGAEYRGVYARESFAVADPPHDEFDRYVRSAFRAALSAPEPERAWPWENRSRAVLRAFVDGGVSLNPIDYYGAPMLSASSADAVAWLVDECGADPLLVFFTDREGPFNESCRNFFDWFLVWACARDGTPWPDYSQLMRYLSARGLEPTIPRWQLQTLMGERSAAFGVALRAEYDAAALVAPAARTAAIVSVLSGGGGPNGGAAHALPRAVAGVVAAYAEYPFVYAVAHSIYRFSNPPRTPAQAEVEARQLQAVVRGSRWDMTADEGALAQAAAKLALSPPPPNAPDVLPAAAALAGAVADDAGAGADGGDTAADADAADTAEPSAKRRKP